MKYNDKAGNKTFLIAIIAVAILILLCVGGLTFTDNALHGSQDEIKGVAPQTHVSLAAFVLTPMPAPTPTPDLHPGQMKSLLTGQWTDINIASKRPVAIMLNNSKGGVPQNGLSNASVIYEATMEGSETRLMGIFEDYEQAGRIGSVRSCRPYFVYFAQEFNAIYCHFGQAWVADELLNSGVIDNVSGLKSGSAAYYRSSDRKAPHNVFTDYQRIQETAAKLGYNMLYPDGSKSHYLFADDQTVSEYPQGQSAVYVKPGFPVNKPYFLYHPEDGLYYRFQYGKEQIDECNGQQAAVRNIILQYCESSIYDGSEYVNFTISGCGRGMFITNGMAIPITWQKDSEYGVTKYYDEQGHEILLNQGKTWVCVMPTKQESSVVVLDAAPEE